MKKYTVHLTMLFSSLCFVFLFLGLWLTIQTHFFNGKYETIDEAKKEMAIQEVPEKGEVIVALGDSLTRGTGDADGKGYIGYLSDQLNEKTKEAITLHNLGVTGYRSQQLLNQIKQPEVIRQIGTADMILITIGGNDLFQSGQTILTLDLQKVQELKNEYLLNLNEIMKQLRSVNQDATIFLIGLYNPFIDLSDAEVTTEVVRQWNFETSQVLDRHKNTVFVPTFDLFQLKVNDYLYTDKFHPNSEGYKLIAERIVSLITW